MKRIVVTLLFVLSLAACGGGSGGSDFDSASPNANFSTRPSAA